MLWLIQRLILLGCRKNEILLCIDIFASGFHQRVFSLVSAISVGMYSVCIKIMSLLLMPRNRESWRSLVEEHIGNIGKLKLSFFFIQFFLCVLVLLSAQKIKCLLYAYFFGAYNVYFIIQKGHLWIPRKFFPIKKIFPKEEDKNICKKKSKEN